MSSHRPLKSSDNLGGAAPKQWQRPRRAFTEGLPPVQDARSWSTFRTSCGIRLGFAMRANADVRQRRWIYEFTSWRRRRLPFSRSAVHHVHAGLPSRIPSTVERPLDLCRELKQQAVIGLLRDRLDAERQAVRVRCERQ